MRRGVKAFAAAGIVAQAAALIRFVILARLLGAEELGLAAMLILTSLFFQAVSETGSDRFLVQDDSGDSPVMQGFVQLVLVLRGVAIAVALVAFAGPVAALYHQPQLASALRGLALAPLIAGLIHLDFRRAQRTDDFRAESLGMFLSEILSLVATAVAAVMTRDHTAVIYGMIVRSVVLVVVSHFTATRPYRWAWGKVESLRFTTFAAPLFLNGLLLFFGGQGDRLVVGSTLGAAELGYYSAILLLVYYPSGVLIRFTAGVSLPQLARARDEPQRFLQETDRFGGRTTLLALGVVAGFALVAPIFTPIFYGKGFAQPLDIFALIGALQAARYLRVWPTTVANGIGRSTVILYNNIARMIGLPVALVMNLQFHSLEAILLGFIAGEVAAMLAAFILLARAKALRLHRELVRVGVFLAGCATVTAAAWAIETGTWLALPVVGTVALAIGAFLWTSESAVIADTVALVRRRLNRKASGAA